jgi:hypothetical protein
MVEVPTIEVVVVDGVALFEVSGCQVVSRHQQLAQAQIAWFILASAAGWRVPAPVILASAKP